MYRLDLHTHSTRSRDGSINADQYKKVLKQKLLDYVAITDHNHISFAVQLQKELGKHIIVGEEINTKEGEVIGLFLKERITRDQSALNTVKAIKKQGGLVYIPHPFETVRSGLPKKVLENIIEHVDIIEVFNGRALFQNKGPQATTFARINSVASTASSDAHGVKGLGTVHTIIQKAPTAKNLVDQLATAKLVMKRPPLKTLLYPKANRIRKGWIRD